MSAILAIQVIIRAPHCLARWMMNRWDQQNICGIVVIWPISCTIYRFNRPASTLAAIQAKDHRSAWSSLMARRKEDVWWTERLSPACLLVLVKRSMFSSGSMRWTGTRHQLVDDDISGTADWVWFECFLHCRPIGDTSPETAAHTWFESGAETVRTDRSSNEESQPDWWGASI